MPPAIPFLPTVKTVQAAATTAASKVSSTTSTVVKNITAQSTNANGLNYVPKLSNAVGGAFPSGALDEHMGHPTFPTKLLGAFPSGALDEHMRAPNFNVQQMKNSEIASTPAIEEDQNRFGYKVRLIAVRKFPEEYVIFEVTPSFSESRTIEYASVSPVHMPGSIQVYKKTNSRTFSLTAHFVSRTVKQATDNIEYLQRLRGWSMPYFGARSAYDGDTQPLDSTEAAISQATSEGSMLGAPPDVLYLYAYSSSQGSGADRSDGRVNIKKLPVVMTSLNITYPEDVDYLPVSVSSEPFPTKMDVTIELVETHSPNAYENFSLSMFKQGKLVQF